MKQQHYLPLTLICLFTCLPLTQITSEQVTIKYGTLTSELKRLQKNESKQKEKKERKKQRKTKQKRASLGMYKDLEQHSLTFDVDEHGVKIGLSYALFNHQLWEPSLNKEDSCLTFVHDNEDEDWQGSLRISLDKETFDCVVAYQRAKKSWLPSYSQSTYNKHRRTSLPYMLDMKKYKVQEKPEEERWVVSIPFDTEQKTSRPTRHNVSIEQHTMCYSQADSLVNPKHNFSDTIQEDKDSLTIQVPVEDFNQGKYTVEIDADHKLLVIYGKAKPSTLHKSTYWYVWQKDSKSLCIGKQGIISHAMYTHDLANPLDFKQVSITLDKEQSCLYIRLAKLA